MRNVERFKRDHETYHTIMEMQLNEEIEEIMEVIEYLTVDYNDLLVRDALDEDQNYVNDELNKTHFIILSTAVF